MAIFAKNAACKNVNHVLSLPALPENADKCVILKYFQFETVEHNYVSKKGKNKATKRVERVEHFVDVEFIHNLLKTLTVKYAYHRYQISNDKYEWPSILQTVKEDSPIFHMDYSENLQLTPKFEPQSAHFNKVSSSLHCTVAHGINDDGHYFNSYLYHFSDETKHDSAFTFSVIDDIIERYPEITIYRFKSDNCSTQYKSKYVFNGYKTLAVKHQKVFLVYFGVSGHGKGLVDAMSGFGVKGPLSQSILQENKMFYNSSEMINFLKDKKAEKDYWHYIEIDPETIRKKREVSDKFKINGCKKLHMIAFHPDGKVLGKCEICSCKKCLKGYFLDCKVEVGKSFKPETSNEDSDDETDESDEELEADEDLGSDEELESDELPRNTYFDIITEGSFVAIYSFVDVTELFYICKVLEKKVAADDIKDDFHHLIKRGQNFIIGHYLEQDQMNGRAGKVIYKYL